MARDPEVAAALGVEGPGLEGFLFPETYRLPHGLTPRQVASVMVQQFHRAWKEIADEAEAPEPEDESKQK